MPVLVKLRTIKWHYKSILILLQQILWTCCIFLSSINNTFFSVLIIIFINMSHFCFSYTDTFFIHTMNYFSVVLGIIFLVCMENYFSQCREFILCLQCFVGLAVKVDWFESLTSLGDHFENFEVEECFQRECHSETLSGKETKEVFMFFTKSVCSQ